MELQITTAPLAEVRETPETTRRGPASIAELFVFFTLLALQGFGGLVGIVQREMVDRKGWLTIEEFTDDWALAQALPGPNVINLVLMYGDRRFGIRGALIGVAGLLGAPLVLLVGVTIAATNFVESTLLHGALRGVGAVAAALIAGSGLRMIPTLRTNAIGAPACFVLGVLTFGAVALMQLPVLPTMLGLGSLGCTLALHRMRSRGPDR